MVSEMIVDRVIGTKYCKKCNTQVAVESYTVPGAIELLAMYPTCPRILTTPDPEPLGYYRCGHTEFTTPRFEIKMKPSKPWVSKILKRMG